MRKSWQFSAARLRVVCALALATCLAIAGGALAQGNGGGAEAPVNIQPPELKIIGQPKDPVVGAKLRCDHGRWTGAGSFQFTWKRDGEEFTSSEGPRRHDAQPEDSGTTITCEVTRTHRDAVSEPATSNPVTILAAGPPEPDPSRFQKVLLEDTNLDQPVRISVTEDGRVIYIERAGAVRVWDPETELSVTAGTVPTEAVGETGLIGLTLAPTSRAPVISI